MIRRPEPFQGGNNAAQQKLRDKLNQVAEGMYSNTQRFEGSFFDGHQGRSGSSPRLSLNRLLPRIPRNIAVDSGLIMVLVKNDGGTQGDETSQCSFTYSVWPEGGDIQNPDTKLAELLTPILTPRDNIGAYIVAPEGSYGLAYQSPTGLLLLMVAEQRLWTLCPAPPPPPQ